ncbi:MAG TPA: ferredoxin [Bacteroidales bacterium]|nr:ferredoxin [Bacteroidales bacterium]
MSKFQVNLKINNLAIAVDEGTTILEAARQLNFNIPTLCHHDDICVAGNCRVCVVEQKGSRLLPAACATPVGEGMEILTNSMKVRQARKHVVELLLSEHNADCTRCIKNGECELQKMSNEYRTGNNQFISLLKEKDKVIDFSSPSISKDDSKCIRCQRCVRTCAEMQAVNALTVAYKGNNMRISTFLNKPMNDVVCTNCGQCINRCPTGSLTERTYVDQVFEAVYDPTKFVVVQTAPATRVAIGEEFGLEPGTRVTGKMVAALRRIGFDKVLDTDFSADLTIIEEGYELLSRLKAALVDGKAPALPMMTSCSPGWIKFQEHLYPELLENLSSCKSPQQMFGALAKTYYAERMNKNPADMIVVSIMPCTAKKFEANRPEMRGSGYKDVDFVLTTRELGMMIRQAGIDFNKLENESYDGMLGESTGAGVIFGNTGGVMEAALRTAYEIITGREVPFSNLSIKPVRGMEGVKEAAIRFKDVLPEWNFLEGVELKVGITHGLANAKLLMDKVKEGNTGFHFIEIMACPGGCIGGGGQPLPTTLAIRKKRASGLYEEDEKMILRKSHENPEVKELYQSFLHQPLGHRSHDLLHTHYYSRKKI